MNGLRKVAHWLLIIGGLNWLLWGVATWEIGHLFGGMDAVVSRIIYILVGISALIVVFMPKAQRRATPTPVAPAGNEGM